MNLNITKLYIFSGLTSFLTMDNEKRKFGWVILTYIITRCAYTVLLMSRLTILNFYNKCWCNVLEQIDTVKRDYNNSIKYYIFIIIVNSYPKNTDHRA